MVSKLMKEPNTFSGPDSQYIAKVRNSDFEEMALEVFQFQYEQNSVYKSYVDAIKVNTSLVKRVVDIPFLPIDFFKTHWVVSGEPRKHVASFESSGTTGENTSKHYVVDEGIYKASLSAGFREFYGEPGEYAILALLPGYLERGNSSLVYMARELMQQSGHAANGFYLNEWELLYKQLQQLETRGQKSLLIGVTYALLDFAERYPMELRNTVVMETGGMKGRRTEWTRAQVHDFLRKQWMLKTVHSEYGMTELLSQAYAKEGGVFRAAKTARVLVRELNDPLHTTATGSGCLNIIDLANLHSCAFIATEDLGTVYPDGSFTVLGRMDHSALRGCSLMAV